MQGSNRGAWLVLVVHASEFGSVGVANIGDVERGIVIGPRTWSPFIAAAVLQRGGVESSNLGFVLRAKREHRAVPRGRRPPIERIADPE